ncbi:hypothetical protein MMC20_002972 [Loxospora ochrophaea]|nr:hypothetical protein [Loxospora ochrophaea]
MAAASSPTLRYLLNRTTPYLRGGQRRWAQVHDVRFLATHREPDRVIEKYKEKLNKKAKEVGLKDADELKEAFKDKIEDFKKKASSADPSSTAPPSTSPFPPPPPPPRIPSKAYRALAESVASESASNPPGVKTLSSFIDVPKTLKLPPKEIEYIWRLRHASNPQSLCAVIPQSTYDSIESTARRHPQFILPLPREGQGAEIHYLQWTFPTPTTTTILFTHLAEFKLRGEFSQPHTTVTHHLDLREEKGLVLLQGSVVEGRGVSVDEGRWLLMCLQKFYGGGEQGGEKKKLLEQFSQGDGEFKVEQLLEEAEKVG